MIKKKKIMERNFFIQMSVAYPYINNEQLEFEI